MKLITKQKHNLRFSIYPLFQSYFSDASFIHYKLFVFFSFYCLVPIGKLVINFIDFNIQEIQLIITKYMISICLITLIYITFYSLILFAILIKHN